MKLRVHGRPKRSRVLPKVVGKPHDGKRIENYFSSIFMSFMLQCTIAKAVPQNPDLSSTCCVISTWISYLHLKGQHANQNYLPL